MQTNAPSPFERVESTDEPKICFLCEKATEPNPRTLQVRREGGASHGLIEAKAHICRDCLESTDGWEYNQVKSRNQDDSDDDGAEILTDGGRSIDDYVDLGEELVGDGGQQIEDSDDQDDLELPHFEHIQRLDGRRFLEIQTEESRFIVQLERDDLERLKEVIEDTPTCF